jgi:hypothetical protein
VPLWSSSGAMTITSCLPHARLTRARISSALSKGRSQGITRTAPKWRSIDHRVACCKARFSPLPSSFSPGTPSFPAYERTRSSGVETRIPAMALEDFSTLTVLDSIMRVNALLSGGDKASLSRDFVLFKCFTGMMASTFVFTENLSIQQALQ